VKRASIYFLFVLFCAVGGGAGALATADTIKIAGQDVQVLRFDTRAAADGRTVIHSAQLAGPTVFSFERGNQMTFKGRVVLHDNGRLWMAEALEKAPLLLWKTPRGQVLNLHCAQPPEVNGQKPPVRSIAFHDNGEYAGGCRVVPPTEMSTRAQDVIQVASFSEINLDEEGFLLYAQHATGVLTVNQQKVVLDADSEVDFWENAGPHFFRLAKGEVLKVSAGRLGEIAVDRGARLSYVQFNRAGQLEAGVLNEALTVSGIEIPAQSLISFEQMEESETPSLEREFTALLLTSMPLQVGALNLEVAQIHFDAKNEVSGVVTAKKFEFHSPEGDVIAVPKGSKIYFSQGRVVRIDVSAL